MARRGAGRGGPGGKPWRRGESGGEKAANLGGEEEAAGRGRCILAARMERQTSVARWGGEEEANLGGEEWRLGLAASRERRGGRCEEG